MTAPLRSLMHALPSARESSWPKPCMLAVGDCDERRELAVLTKAIKQIDRRYIIGAIAYALLVAASGAWVATTNWWNISITGDWPGVKFSSAVLGFGMAFWALVGAFCFYFFIRLDRFGRFIFTVLGGALGLIVVLNWPGFLDSDSIATISDSREVPRAAWYGFSPIITGAILHHIPFLGSLVVVQCTFLALAVAYALQTLREYEGKTAAWIALGLVAVSLPIHYNALLVVRETWVAIASLLVATECIRFFRDSEWRNGQTFGRLLACAIVAWCLRSECLLYVVVVLGFGILRLSLSYMRDRATINWRSLKLKPFAPALLALALTQVVLPLAVRSYPQNAGYDITLWLEPVGDIMSNNSAAVDTETRETIYEFIAPEVFDIDWNSENIVAKYWVPMNSKLIKLPENDEDRSRLNTAAFRVAMSDFNRFIANRIHAFDLANAPDARYDEIAVQPTQVFVTSPRAQAAVAGLQRELTYGGWFNPFREQVEQLFASTERGPVGAAQWAVYPDILLLVIVALLLPWAPGYAMAAMVLLTRIPSLFLFMPAPQSKYFFPADLVVPFIVVGAAAVIWNKIAARRKMT